MIKNSVINTYIIREFLLCTFNVTLIISAAGLIMNLREELNIPHKLSDVIDKDKIDLNLLCKMALDDPSTNGNPKKLNIDDIKTMYEHSISGKLF